MRQLLLLTLIASLTACSSGSSSGGGTPPVLSSTPYCEIENDTIELEHGEDCEFTAAQSEPYSLSSSELRCNNGTLTYNENQFSSQNGISFNGLEFICQTASN